MNPKTLEAILKATDVALQVLAKLAPPFFAFLRRDSGALALLLKAIPDIYATVEQERRKAGLPAIPDPIKRGLELAAEYVGRALTEAEMARVRDALRAHHERTRGQ
jgi:hypothetical protein